MQELLRKRDQLRHEARNGPETSQGEDTSLTQTPTPLIFRSNTVNEELIYPPSSPELSPSPSHQSPQPKPTLDGTASPQLLPSPRHRFRPTLHIRRRSKNNNADDLSPNEENGSLSPLSPTGTGRRSFSDRMKTLSLKPRSRTSSASSVHVPENLPDISVTNSAATSEDNEAEWERRAALLAQHQRSRSPSSQSITSETAATSRTPSPMRPSPMSAETIDAQIQTAISLHESGELERSTAIFRTLADPNGANNPFSQTLYGLALQHGWGCDADPKSALHYHTLAASNSADISLPSLHKPSQTPTTTTASTATRTAARGELVLAIYELGNTFRHGLGCAVDPIAARRYYETAAELGDADAMVEAAWCYEHGFGGGKDRWRAARYLRMAEGKGVRMVGNSWIYKEKYMTAVPGVDVKGKKGRKERGEKG